MDYSKGMYKGFWLYKKLDRAGRLHINTFCYVQYLFIKWYDDLMAWKWGFDYCLYFANRKSGNILQNVEQR